MKTIVALTCGSNENAGLRLLLLDMPRRTLLRSPRLTQAFALAGLDATQLKSRTRHRQDVSQTRCVGW